MKVKVGSLKTLLGGEYFITFVVVDHLMGQVLEESVFC